MPVSLTANVPDPLGSPLIPAPSVAAGDLARRWVLFLWPWVAGIGVWLLVLSLALVWDTACIRWATSIAPDGTIARRILKLARYPFHWYAFVGLGLWLYLRSGESVWKLSRLRLERLGAFATTILLCVGPVHLLKFVLGRARPQAGLGPYYFDVFGMTDVYHSFPSGHAAQTALLTALLALYAPWSVWILAPLAVLACLSRVVQERHFPSDVIASMGYIVLTVVACRQAMGKRAFPRLDKAASATVP